MNNLLKDFKIQPTKLRGENMEIKQKALDGVNEITQDTKTGITTTTLVHTFKPCIDLFDGNEHIAHYETDTEFIEDFKRMKQELTNLKAIEKEHQRMNGELREENKQLKENVNNAIERLEALIIFWKKYNPIDNTMQVGQFEGVIEMLKGGNDEK